MPVLGMPLAKPLCSCLSDLLHIRSKKVSLQLPVSSHMQNVPDEVRHRSGQYIQLSGRDFLFLEWISVNPLPYYFNSGFSPHNSWVL